jgi:chitinase
VEFFANANLLGEATAIPYSIVASNLSAGSYALTSIASDNGGLMSTSAPVTISVVTPLAVTLSSPIRNNGRFEFNYTANAGLRYAIENSSNLVNWTSLATNTASGGTELYGEAFDVNFLRFYRVERLLNP